jgi:hypothetical protein
MNAEQYIAFIPPPKWRDGYGRLWRTVSEVISGKDRMIVSKWYSRRRGWVYNIEHAHEVEFKFKIKSYE